MYKKLLEEVILRFNTNSDYKSRIEITEVDSLVDEAKRIKYKLNLIHETSDGVSVTMIYSMKKLNDSKVYKEILKSYTEQSFWIYSRQ